MEAQRLRLLLNASEATRRRLEREYEIQRAREAFEAELHELERKRLDLEENKRKYDEEQAKAALKKLQAEQEAERIRLENARRLREELEKELFNNQSKKLTPTPYYSVSEMRRKVAVEMNEIKNLRILAYAKRTVSSQCSDEIRTPKDKESLCEDS